MIRIRRFFEIQFTDRQISLQELRKFTEDHLQRLAAANTANQYDTMINDTEAVYNTFFGAINDHDTRLALQQSRTKSMQNIQEQFVSTVQHRHGLITNTFDEETPEYQEFFPHGLTEYDQNNLQNIETLMTRMVTASHAHIADFGATLETEFAGIKTAFIAARGNQLSQKGLVSDASNAANTGKSSMQFQLTENLLTLALQNLGNPDAASIFFDESILNLSNGNGDDTPPSP